MTFTDLQFFLYPGDAEQRHVPLEALHHGGYLGDVVYQAQLGGEVALLEFHVGLLRERLLRDDERPEPLAGHVVHLLHQPVRELHDGTHHSVGTLHVEDDLSGALLPQDDPHPLGLGGEEEGIKSK